MNKVTMQGILDKIKKVTYSVLPDGRTTICQLTMANGFTINGKSGCVDAKLFDKALGEKYAYEDALNECWPFEGYLLAERMHAEKRADEAMLGNFKGALTGASGALTAGSIPAGLLVSGHINNIGNAGLRPPYQQRVIDEKRDNDDRLEKLNAFLLATHDGNSLDDPREQRRLLDQRLCMTTLSHILADRVAAFDAANVRGSHG